MNELIPYVFDAPVQRLRANDRVLSSPEPRLYGETVLYVRAAQRAASDPVPYAPVTVVTAPHPGSIAAASLERIEEEPIVVPWGTRVTIERVPDAGETYYVGALEPLPQGSRLTIQVLTELEVRPGDYPDAFGYGEMPAAGVVISELLGPGEGEVIAATPREGEAIGVWWYVNGHRVETPAEHSARDAADLFADHTVRLRPAGSDAGETCPACRRIISWVDHLPPPRRGEPARCTARRAS